MSDFYNSMGPLAALSLFGLMGNRNKKRGGMSGLVEPTQQRDAPSGKARSLDWVLILSLPVLTQEAQELWPLEKKDKQTLQSPEKKL